MNKELSSYLDFLRFLAALAVLVGHMEQDGLYMSWFPLAQFSHDAVVVFFVLSGFIIYSTTVGAGRPAKDYVIARVSRIYSVVLPAVIFSFLCGFWMVYQVGEGGAYPSNFRLPSLLDFFSSLLFLNESWLNTVTLTMNAPFWSLCYEVWYYALFGLWLFLAPPYRWPLILLAATIAGPAILALFPIWLGGAWLARHYDRLQSAIKPQYSVMLFPGTLLFIVTIKHFGIDIDVKEFLHESVPGFWRLDSSQRMITDFMIGLALMLNIVAFSGLPAVFSRFFLRYQGLFGYLAGFSFTLYLFHRPMTQIVGFYYPNNGNSVFYSLCLMFGILLACLSISYVTERQLKRYRVTFGRLATRFGY